MIATFYSEMGTRKSIISYSVALELRLYISSFLITVGVRNVFEIQFWFECYIRGPSR
jgi:hypothetical protein